MSSHTKLNTEIISMFLCYT